MMTEWIKLINTFGPWVFILIVVALYTQGKIISKKTVDRLEQSYEKNIKSLRDSYESTIDKICKNHANETKLLTTSFNKSLAQLKEMIRIFKQKNGIKEQ